MIKHVVTASIAFLLLAGITVYGEAPSYKVDTSFDGKTKTDIIYMDSMPGDGVCYIDSSGNVSVIDASGNQISSFKPDITGTPASIAAGKDGTIYVFSTVTQMVDSRRRGKTHKRRASVASHCTVYDAKGEKKRSFTIEDVKEVKASRVINDKLALADGTQRAVVMVDIKTGKVLSKAQKGIRICCGIFDFCVGPENSIMVANLGGFKVQSYNAAGKPTKSFGKRGKDLDSFHGCCNPVSVARLSTGAIFTAEKSPTRVKVYDSEGRNAKTIEGIDELVKGCTHIPMVADSKGNVYLASRRKGMLKCVPTK